jgi:DNA primase
MRYPDDVIQRVRDASDIVAVVGEYVALKKAGSSFKGLCPFHTEKTPSFVVSPSRNTFHCFGCGKGGNAITFLMEMERIPFPEALQLLAGKAGVELPKPREEARDTERERERERLFALHEFAGAFFYGQLTTPAGRRAVEYLKERRITGETAKRFQIGFAPDAWDALKNAALKAGYAEKELVTGGLLAVNEEKGRNYDKFRDRVVFPVKNNFGKIIAFGGRALGEGPGPKYLNSPETPLFKKGENLYLLDAARDAIRREGRVLVVEGYFDAVTLHQSGIANAVATLGTALTREHAVVLKRYTQEVVLLYDADPAGQDAAVRGFEPLLEAGLGVRVLTLPDAKDPDEYLGRHPREDLEALVRGAPEFFRWRARRLREAMKDRPVEERLRSVQGLVPLLLRLPGEAAVQAACAAVESELGAGKLDLLAIVNAERKRPVPRAAPSGAVAAPVAGFPRDRRMEADFLALLAYGQAEFVHWASQEVSPDLFMEEDLKALFTRLAMGDLSPAEVQAQEGLTPHFLELEERLSARREESRRDELRKTLLTQMYASLEMRLQKRRMQELRAEQVAAEKAGDIGRAAELGREIAEWKRKSVRMERMRAEPHEWKE